ncbi:MAG: DALR domain-containing protein, partial [Nitrosopumilaceae archaeon]|nr:DALR domain-containing protein [Nitrosopumilaceae archaeon]
ASNQVINEQIDEFLSKVGMEFDEALEDDFNTHLALSAFFSLIKETNRLAAEENLGKNQAMKILPELERMLEILGLTIPKISEEQIQEINQMIKNREKFRAEKNFSEADKIRDNLNEMNIELIDHKGKTIWMKKEKIKADL